MPDTDVDDTEYVDISTPVAPKRHKAATGTCKECGKELDDGRKAYCDEHKPKIRDKVTGKGRGKGKGVTKAVEDGMAETVGKVLFLLTLAYAYSALRSKGIPDPSGQISDAMALTDDESVMIARPLARLFMSTEQGRKVAPKIVDNSDLIDAAFAMWDWYSRMNETLAQYQSTQSVQTPIVRNERDNRNESNTPSEGDRVSNNGNHPGFIPPNPQDQLADI